MASFQDLPNELILEILELLGNEYSLPDIILASKFFHQLATPILYRRICLQIPQSCSWRDGIPISGLRLLRTFLENPHLGLITEELQVDTAGVIHREILAMLQQQKLLVQWQGRLLTREREALERETFQLQEYLSFQAQKLKFLSSQRNAEKLSAQIQEYLSSPSRSTNGEASSKSELEGLKNPNALKAPPEQDEAFRLYGMIDGSVSQAIALRKAEVTSALERNEMDFRRNFGTVSTRSIVAKMAVKPISDSRRQSLKNEYLPVLTKVLLPSWTFESLTVDPQTQASEEFKARKESLIADLRIFAPHTVQSRVRSFLETADTHFQIFPELEDDSLFPFVDGLLSFLPNIKGLNLHIPQTCFIPRPELAPFPSRYKGQYLERLTKVTLGYSDGHIKATHLKHFFELRSLKAIGVWGCFGFGPKSPQSFDYENSSVTKLALKSCLLAPSWLQDIVKLCSDLQHLEFSHSFTETSHLANIYPSSLVLALKPHYKNLISIRCDTPKDISGCGGDRNSICSFDDFTKLTTLDVCTGAVLFFDDTNINNGTGSSTVNSSTDDKGAPLYQRLPTSLQTLVLRHCHERGTTEMFKHLQDLLPRCKDLLPMLRNITLTSPDFDYLDHLTTLRAQFSVRGIQLVCEVCEPSKNCAHCRAGEDAAEVGVGREQTSLATTGA